MADNEDTGDDSPDNPAKNDVPEMKAFRGWPEEHVLAYVEGRFAGQDFRKAEEKEAVKALAHEAKELSNWLAEIGEHLDAVGCEDEEERTHYRDLIARYSAVEPDRKTTPYRGPPPREEPRPWTLKELRESWIKPLGGLWAQWTQVFNRPEFRRDRKAMLAVTRVLKALSEAFWNDEKATPQERDAESEKVLDDLDTTAGAYLRKRDEDVVRTRPELVLWLGRGMASRMCHPFRDDAGERRTPTDADLDETADRLTERLYDSLEHGFSFTDLRADLAEDFASTERKAAVRTTIRKHLDNFDPWNEETIEEGVKKTLRAVLREMGYPEQPTRSLFDALRKRT